MTAPSDILNPAAARPPAGTAAARVRRVWRGRAEDPAWARPAFLALLLGTLVLYLWDLGASGYANSFYSAAVQAGSQSWKAFFFGSSDAANSITVDKPPAALWPMALSVRVFGLGSWQILAPEALMGVAAVGVLYAAVRRRFGPGAGLLAGAVLALTPVAALMFRFNNPDALLALLMVAAVYCVLRALERASARWLVLAGVAFGLAFLTKTLQAWLIVPPLAVVYGVCAPARARTRLLHLLCATAAMLVSCGWWVAIVQLWPASSRPYIGGSQDNSFLGLTFGYNGFGRITGHETGSVGGGGFPGGIPGGLQGGLQGDVPGGGGGPGAGPGGGGGGMWGQTGIGRLFGADMGGQISWLLPAAFLCLAAGLWATRRARRADTARAAYLAWGGALLFTFTTFSFMSGIFHQYYNIALAPYIAALVGMGASDLWRRRERIAAAATLAVAATGTALWAYVLLDRSPDWHPWLRTAVVAAGFAAGAGLLAGPVAAALSGLRAAPSVSAASAVSAVSAAPSASVPAVSAASSVPASSASASAAPASAAPGRAVARVGTVAAVAGLAAALGGPVAYTLDTVSTGHQGSIVTAGPAVTGARGGFPGGGGPRGGGFPGGGNAPGGAGTGDAGTGGAGTGTGGFPGGTAGGTGQGRNGQVPQGGSPGFPGGRGGFPGAQGAAGGAARGGASGGGMGGLLNGTQVGAAMKKLLLSGASGYTWVAATVGSQNQASYQLAVQKPVMAIGGFNGSDPSPTLAQFTTDVAGGRIHYFIASGTGAPGGMGGSGTGAPGGMGGSGTAAQITAWVQSHFPATTVAAQSVYDLTTPTST